MANNNLKTNETLSETLTELNKKGFVNTFIVKDDAVYCVENNLKLNPDDFEIAEYKNFEAIGDIEDDAIAYAIKSDKLNIKGVIVDTYGAYSNTVLTSFLSKIKKTNPL